MRQSREYQLKMDLKPNMLVLIYMGKCTSFMRYTYKSTFCLKSTLYPKHKRALHNLHNIRCEAKKSIKIRLKILFIK